MRDHLKIIIFHLLVLTALSFPCQKDSDCAYAIEFCDPGTKSCVLECPIKDDAQNCLKCTETTQCINPDLLCHQSGYCIEAPSCIIDEECKEILNSSCLNNFCKKLDSPTRKRNLGTLTQSIGTKVAQIQGQMTFQCPQNVFFEVGNNNTVIYEYSDLVNFDLKKRIFPGRYLTANNDCSQVAFSVNKTKLEIYDFNNISHPKLVATIENSEIIFDAIFVDGQKVIAVFNSNVSISFYNTASSFTIPFITIKSMVLKTGAFTNSIMKYDPLTKLIAFADPTKFYLIDIQDPSNTKLYSADIYSAYYMNKTFIELNFDFFGRDGLKGTYHVYVMIFDRFIILNIYNYSRIEVLYDSNYLADSIRASASEFISYRYTLFFASGHMIDVRDHENPIYLGRLDNNIGYSISYSRIWQTLFISYSNQIKAFKTRTDLEPIYGGYCDVDPGVKGIKLYFTPDHKYFFYRGKDYSNVIQFLIFELPDIHQYYLPTTQSFDTSSREKKYFTSDGIYKMYFVPPPNPGIVYSKTHLPLLKFVNQPISSEPDPKYQITFIYHTAFISIFPSYQAILDLDTGLSVRVWRSTGSFQVSRDQRYIFSCCAFSYKSNLNNMRLELLDTHLAEKNIHGVYTILSKEEKLMFGLNSLSEFIIYNISNPAKMRILSRNFFGEGCFKIRLTKNNLFALVANQSHIMVLEISDLATPKVVSYWSGGGEITDFRFRLDEKILFVTLKPIHKGFKNGFTTLNTSDLYYPQIAGSLETLGSYEVKISSDGKIATLTDKVGVITVNISNPYTLGKIMVFSLPNTLYASDYINGEIYYSDGNDILRSKIESVDNLILMENNNFQLGNSYNIQASLTIKWKDSSLGTTRLIPLGGTHNILNVMLYSFSDVGERELRPLPFWIAFNKENGFISVDPTAANLIGVYYIICFASTQVMTSRFRTLFKNDSSPDDTVNKLFSQDLSRYMDPTGFLSENFNPDVKLVLSSPFLSKESSMRSIMTESYIVALGSFSVSSSLEIQVTEQNFFKITTPSTNSIKVTIEISNEKVKFVNKKSKTTASIKIEDNFIVINAQLNDINNVLTEITIDFPLGLNSSAGTISVSDDLNPQKNFGSNQITNFFNLNHAPVIINSFREYFSRSSIYTGQQFSLIINPNDYTDPDGDELKVSIRSATGERPEWIDFVGTTLTGTPPMKSGIEVSLIVSVSDGYKSVEEEFHIEVEISFELVLSWLGTYIGPFIAIIGARAYAYRVYNIFCIEKYRHGKVFKVQAGQTLNDEVIYPIEIIGDEAKEARQIVKEMLERFLRRERMKTCGRIKILFDKKLKFARDFFDKKGNIRESFLKEEIDLAWIRVKEKNVASKQIHFVSELKQMRTLKSYKKSDELIVHQIIHDKITMIRLKSSKSTHNVFEFLMPYWSILVSLDLSSESSVFSMDEEKFNELLKRKNLLKYSDQPIIPSQNGHTWLEKDLQIKREKPNIKKKYSYSLLKTGMDAYVRRRSQVRLREEKYVTQSNRLYTGKSTLTKIKDFLRLNLYPLRNINKDSIGFGIIAEKRRYRLHFRGKVDETMEGLVLVFQITNLRGRILHEIFIECPHSGVYSRFDSGVLLKREIVYLDDPSPVNTIAIGDYNSNSSIYDNKFFPSGAMIDTEEEGDLEEPIDLFPILSHQVSQVRQTANDISFAPSILRISTDEENT